MSVQPAPSDAAILETASALVVLTVDTYRSLQALPVDPPPTPGDLLASAVDALERARTELADATRAAGGRPAPGPDPRYAPVVAAALPTVRVPGDVVGLALTLEDVLAQTLVADAALLGVPERRRLVVGIATAAAGRKAVLLILQSLLATGQPGPTGLVAPPDLAALPAGVGTVGFPDTRFPTDKAAPVDEPGPADEGTPR